MPLSPLRRLAFSLITLSAAIGLAVAGGEGLLRIVGFAYHPYPTKVQFGYPDPVTLEDRYVLDDDLFWVTKDYAPSVRAWRRQRPSVVFMGCSCTQFSTYDRCFAALVRERHPAVQFRGVNAGVGGWTTFQGLRQLQRDVIPMKPRIVTVYYGWNDHWTNFGVEDKIRDGYTFHRRGLRRLNRLRLVQLVGLLRVRCHQRFSAHEERVSPEDFRRNIEEMVRLARRHGIVPVLMTAPSAHTRGDEPTYLAKGFLKDLSNLVPVHQQYVTIVRQVAKEKGVALVDLAANYAALPIEDVKQKYFWKDGIHVSPEGDKKTAEFMYRAFETNGVLDLILR